MKKATSKPANDGILASQIANDAAEVMAKLIEAGIPFAVSYFPDGSDPKTQYTATLDGRKAHAGTPAEALLKATASFVKYQHKEMHRVKTLATEGLQRLAKIEELLPGLSAHVPNSKGVCEACGDKHSADGLQEAVGKALGLSPEQMQRVQLIRVDGDDEDEDKDEDVNEEN